MTTRRLGTEMVIAPVNMAGVEWFRRWAGALCIHRGATPAAVRSVRLLVSELATNVVLHAPATLLFTLRAQIGPMEARFELDDLESRGPTFRPSAPGHTNGHGLRMVAALSSGWGWIPDPAGGKTVWFTIPMR